MVLIARAGANNLATAVFGVVRLFFLSSLERNHAAKECRARSFTPQTAGGPSPHSTRGLAQGSGSIPLRAPKRRFRMTDKSNAARDHVRRLRLLSAGCGPQPKVWWRGKESAHRSTGRDARATIKRLNRRDKEKIAVAPVDF